MKTEPDYEFDGKFQYVALDEEDVNGGNKVVGEITYYSDARTYWRTAGGKTGSAAREADAHDNLKKAIDQERGIVHTHPMDVSSPVQPAYLRNTHLNCAYRGDDAFLQVDGIRPEVERDAGMLVHMLDHERPRTTSELAYEIVREEMECPAASSSFMTYERLLAALAFGVTIGILSVVPKFDSERH